MLADVQLAAIPNRRPSYEPAYGRFLQPDPIGYDDGPNLYAYVGNDPVNWVDPLGLGAVWRWRKVCVAGTCGWSGYWDWEPGTASGGGAGSGGGGGGGGGGGRGSKTSPVTEAAKSVQCRVKSFNVGADFALGFGPVLRGGVGVSYNRVTGRVSWQANIGVGFGAALAAGIGGSMSNTNPSAGYNQSTNFQAALGGGLSAQYSTPNSVNVNVGAGIKAGFEASSTENITKTGDIYTASPSGC